MTTKIAFISLAVFFNAFANIFMKMGVKNKAVSLTEGIVSFILSYITNFYLMLGISFFGVALIFYSKALEKFNLSIAYPVMTSSGLVIVTLWSLFILGEKLSFIQGAGLLCIISGIWLINIH